MGQSHKCDWRNSENCFHIKPHIYKICASHVTKMNHNVKNILLLIYGEFEPSQNRSLWIISVLVTWLTEFRELLFFTPSVFVFKVLWSLKRLHFQLYKCCKMNVKVSENSFDIFLTCFLGQLSSSEKRDLRNVTDGKKIHCKQNARKMSNFIKSTD